MLAFPGYCFNMWFYLPFWIPEHLSALCTAIEIYIWERSLQIVYLNLLRPNDHIALSDKINEK